MLNIVLVSAVIAWFVAQLIKIVITFIKERKINFVLLYASGGMPSSHSSTVTAVAASCGYIRGFDSELFALAAVFAFITMYDAAGVRRAVGEQAKILNQMSNDIWEGNSQNFGVKLKELVGHTPIQVFVGAVLGILIGLLFPYLVGVPFYAA